MKTGALTFCYLLFALMGLSQDYEFTPPAFGPSSTGQVFLHYLEPADGFAANVNLLIQSFQGTLKGYDAVSEEQFAQADVNVLSKKELEGELQYEYEATMQGFDLNFFVRAIKDGPRIYLVTGTCLSSRKETDGVKLRESVRSFKLNRE